MTALFSGTFSPGASLTGLPMPELAGMGATPKGCCCSSAGVSGKLPGVRCSTSAALGLATAAAPVEPAEKHVRMGLLLRA